MPGSFKIIRKTYPLDLERTYRIKKITDTVYLKVNEHGQEILYSHCAEKNYKSQQSFSIYPPNHHKIQVPI